MRHFGGPTNWKHFCAVNTAREKFKQDRRMNALRRYKHQMLQNPTSLETILYNALFELKIPYEPQWIIGDRYIVDVCITGNNKIIEADGFYHEGYRQRLNDTKRDKRLKRMGFDLLHLRHHEFYNVDLLKERIKEFVFGTQSATAPVCEGFKAIDDCGGPVNQAPSQANKELA